MTMPRTPHKPAPILPDPSTVAVAHALTIAEEQETKQIEQDQFAMVMQDIGAMRALSFIRKISGRAQVEIYLKLKETKGWKSVPHPDGRKFSDLDELCEVYLGETGRNIRNKIGNYHLLGAELYEVSERMGFKPRNYTALKALPADDQAIIKQAMADDADRNQVIDLLQEMAARHASEKAALTAEAAEARETAEARDEVVRSKAALVDKLHEENARLKRRVASATPDEVGEQLRAEVSDAAFAAEAAIMGALRLGFEALAAHAVEHGVAHDNFMSGCLAQVEGALNALRADHQVKPEPDSDVRPEWVREGFDPDAAVEAAIGDDLKAFRERMKTN